MRNLLTAAIAVATVSATCGLAAPAFAGSPYYALQDEATVPMRRPRPIARREMGHFTCSYNERSTRLERKNCGGQRF